MHTSVRCNGRLLTPSELIAETILELLDEPDASDRNWRLPTFRQLPERIAENAAYDYKETYIFDGRRDANLFLLEIFGTPRKHSIPLNASDDDLKALAKRIVQEIKSFNNCLLNQSSKIASLLRFAQKYAVKLPALDNFKFTEIGIYTRLTDENWWLRRLRETHAKKLETVAIRTGLVHQRKGKYVSDETLKRRKEQKKRNRRILDGLLAINEMGEGFTLSELVEHGLANPRVRRSELMVRIFGFETIVSPARPGCMRGYQKAANKIRNMMAPSRIRRKSISTMSGQESAPSLSAITCQFMVSALPNRNMTAHRIGISCYLCRLNKPQWLVKLSDVMH